MRLRAKLTDETGWEMTLSRQETSALLENFASTMLLLASFEIAAVILGDRFTVRVADVEVGRWDHALSGVIWAALDPVGRWGSCQCERWREERSCLHIDALLRLSEPEAGRLADILPFPSPPTT